MDKKVNLYSAPKVNLVTFATHFYLQTVSGFSKCLKLMQDHNLFNLFSDPDRPGTKNWLNTCYQLRRPGRWYYYNKMLYGFSEWSTEMANFSYSIKIMEILILTIIWKYICKNRFKYKLGNFQIPRDPFWSPYDITQSLHQVTMSVLRCDLVFANIQAPDFNYWTFFFRIWENL